MDAQVDNDDIAVVEKLLAARFSCRAFRPDPVPRATIERVLTAAQRTASWSNSQAWQVHVLSGSAASTFADVMYQAASNGASHAGDFPFPREYRGIYLDRRRETGFQLYGALGIARGDKDAYRKQSLENFRLFGAPHVAIITSDEALRSMARSTAVVTSATSCWPHKPWASPLSRRQPLPFIRM